jgi:hypothetical protein
MPHIHKHCYTIGKDGGAIRFLLYMDQLSGVMTACNCVAIESKNLFAAQAGKKARLLVFMDDGCMLA